VCPAALAVNPLGCPQEEDWGAWTLLVSRHTRNRGVYGAPQNNTPALAPHYLEYKAHA